MEIRQIGRYQLRRELGRGGMATVYQAFDPEFEREVAVKVLPREFLHDPSFRARFKREAKIIAGLEHPAIVPVYDYGEEDGQPFIVMRLMPGGSLADRIQAGPLNLAEVNRVTQRLAGALDEAHRRGIIHRDLKPANVLFDNRNEPYISDFGIAKLSGGGSSMTGGQIVGTPAYMSPEQARGEQDVDGRSDIYALGVMLFEGLSGRLPYEADTPMGLAVKHLTEPVPDLTALAPNIPRGCQAVISRAMAKERGQRFTTAAELAATLAQTAAPVAGRAESQPKPPIQSRRGLPAWAWAAGIAASLVCLAVVALTSGGLLLARLAPRLAPSLVPGTLATTATPADTPIALVISEPSATPRPSATAAPARTESPAPTPAILDFRACPSACLLDNSNAADRFPEKTTRIFLHWRYENIPAGANYSRIWTNHGQTWVRYRCQYVGPSSGEQNTSLREPGGLRSGDWVLTIFVNGQVLLKRTITVEGAWDFWSPAGDQGQC